MPVATKTNVRINKVYKQPILLMMNPPKLKEFLKSESKIKHSFHITFSTNQNSILKNTQMMSKKNSGTCWLTCSSIPPHNRLSDIGVPIGWAITTSNTSRTNFVGSRPIYTRLLILTTVRIVDCSYNRSKYPPVPLFGNFLKSDWELSISTRI